MRRSKALYKNYVCPICFRQLPECTCPFFPPWSLIMIDEGIQDCVRILNEKGYTTSGSCEGHYTGKIGANTGICFIMDYEDIREAGMPEGFRWIKSKNCIYHAYKGKLDRPAFDAEKEKTLATLRGWCEALPEMRYLFHKKSERR